MGTIIKMKLLKMNKKQVDLVRELLKRGFTVLPSELSKYINGSIQSAKSSLVMAEVEKILKEWELKTKINKQSKED